MQKKFEIDNSSGMSGMKRMVLALSCQMIFYLAWSIASIVPLHSPLRGFFYLPCHMPDMPDVLNFFASSQPGGIYSPLHKPSGMLYIPSQKGTKLWTL